MPRYPYQYACEDCLGYTPADKYKMDEEDYCQDCKCKTVVFDVAQEYRDLRDEAIIDSRY